MADDTKAQLRAVVREVQRLQGLLDGIQATADGAQQTAEAAQRATAQLATALVALVRDTDQDTGELEPDDAEPVVPGAAWLTVTDPDQANSLMKGFGDWLATVYCRWQSTPLPDCWAWHPAVVAELLALRDAWVAAVDPAQGSAAKAMDWLDRYRPGTARRIKLELNGCSLARHTADKRDAYQPPRVHGADMLDELTAWWWQTGGRSSAPSPSAAMLAESRARQADDY